ncbi:MAG: hypothetical protein ACI4MG_08625 [Aristaeellaceae bacterium]
MALLDILKGKKNKAKAEEAAAPEVPAEEKKPDPISLGGLTDSQIENELKILDSDRSLSTVLDDTASRLIATKIELNMHTGYTLQDFRSGIVSDEMPFLDYDTALIAAVEQLENYCKYRPDMAAKAIDLLKPAFQARSMPTPVTKREVLTLKGHYLNAQLVSVQGQLYSSQAAIDSYQKLLAQYEANKALDPEGQRAMFIKQQLEHTEKMKRVLFDNIGTLQATIETNVIEIETAPLEAINPKKYLSSVIEMITEQRETYKNFLRNCSDFQKMLEEMNQGQIEITALERAMELEVRNSMYRLERDRIMRAKRAAIDSYDPAKKATPVPAEPVNAPQPNVVENEAPAAQAAKAEEAPAPQMMDFI